MPWRARERRGSDANPTSDTASCRAVHRHRHLAGSEPRDDAIRKSITNNVCRSFRITEPVSVADRIGLADRIRLSDSVGLADRVTLAKCVLLAERFAVTDRVGLAHT